MSIYGASKVQKETIGMVYSTKEQEHKIPKSGNRRR